MPRDYKLEIMDLEMILNDNSEPPSPIIGDGVLLDRTLLLIHGQPKSRKSFLALKFASAIAKGESFGGFSIPAAQKVLVLSAEGGYFPIRDRLKIMCKDMTDENRRNLCMSFNSQVNFRSDKNVTFVKERIEEIKPKVLVIDPLARFHDAEENSATEMAEVFGTLRGLIEDFSLSIILVHHSGKDDSRGARGSSVILGEYDSCIELKTRDLVSTLSFDMRHVETPADRNVVFNRETFGFDEDNDESPVMQALKDLGGKAAKADLVKKLQEKDDYSQSGAYKAIDSAVEKGIVQTEHGHYSLN